MSLKNKECSYNKDISWFESVIYLIVIHFNAVQWQIILLHIIESLSYYNAIQNLMLFYSILLYCSVSILNEKSILNGTATEPSYEVYTMTCMDGEKRLRMSRSFGDFYLKQNSSLSHEDQAVTAVPDIVVTTRSDR